MSSPEATEDKASRLREIVDGIRSDSTKVAEDVSVIASLQNSLYELGQDVWASYSGSDPDPSNDEDEEDEGPNLTIESDATDVACALAQQFILIVLSEEIVETLVDVVMDSEREFVDEEDEPLRDDQMNCLRVGLLAGFQGAVSFLAGCTLAASELALFAESIGGLLEE